MTTNSYLRTGGILSLIQSVLYIAVIFAFAATPFTEALRLPEAEAFKVCSSSFQSAPMPFIAMAISLLLLGLCGLGAVAPSIGMYFGEKKRGYLKLARYIGMLCMAVITVYFLRYLLISPGIYALNTNTLSYSGLQLLFLLHSPFEPSAFISWFLFFGVGLWVAAVGFASAKSYSEGEGKTEKVFPVICAVKTAGLWIAHIGLLASSVGLVFAGAIIGGLIGGTAFHIYMGLKLRNSS
jgi:hypothetical protein